MPPPPPRKKTKKGTKPIRMAFTPGLVKEFASRQATKPADTGSGVPSGITADQIVNQTISALKAQFAPITNQANLAAGAEQRAAEGLSELLRPISANVQQVYNTGAQAQADIARVLSEQAGAGANAQAAAQDSFLANIGLTRPKSPADAPALPMEPGVGQPGGSFTQALYGSQGYVPGSMMTGEGTALAQAAGFLPGAALLQGQLAAGQRRAAGQEQIGEVSRKIAEVAAEAPKLRREIYESDREYAMKVAQERFDQQLEARKLQLQELQDERDRAWEEYQYATDWEREAKKIEFEAKQAALDRDAALLEADMDNRAGIVKAQISARAKLAAVAQKAALDSAKKDPKSREARAKAITETSENVADWLLDVKLGKVRKTVYKDGAAVQIGTSGPLNAPVYQYPGGKTGPDPTLAVRKKVPVYQSLKWDYNTLRPSVLQAVRGRLRPAGVKEARIRQIAEALLNDAGLFKNKPVRRSSTVTPTFDANPVAGDPSRGRR